MNPVRLHSHYSSAFLRRRQQLFAYAVPARKIDRYQSARGDQPPLGM